MAKKILLVEDDNTIRDAVMAYLLREGYEVTPVGDGQVALDEFKAKDFDMAVLDIMLPNVSGQQICKVIRETSKIPVIMLTAKGEIEDKVMSFEIGADDYLVKPFSPRELIARINALFRRAEKKEEDEGTAQFGDMIIDYKGYKVFIGGEEIDLTLTEFSLLSLLSKNPGVAFSRAELVDNVLDYGFAGYERIIDTHMKNLRSKINDNPKDPKWIHTVHGVGYRFEDPSAK
ncbi:MAG: response regulator transcription factor [Eggerthellaceae bacterium]|nr:response regulator transcription factor [Eggerthellaceae bacterium]